MDSNQLFQFRAIAEAGNITKAANELYITQPALSIALNKLESELDCLLFIRDGKKLTLTDDGKELLKYAVAVTDNICEAEKYFSNAERRKGIKLFRIGAINYPLISRGLINLKDVLFTSSLIERDKVKRILESGEADILLADSESATNEIKGYKKEFLYHQYLLLCVRKEHPLAEKEFVTTDDIKDLVVITHTNPHGFESWMTEIKRANRFNFRDERNSINFMVWCADGANLQLPFFMNNFGISTVWEVVRGFKLIPVKGECTDRNICIWYKESKEKELLSIIDTIKHNVDYVVEGDKNFIK